MRFKWYLDKEKINEEKNVKEISMVIKKENILTFFLEIFNFPKISKMLTKNNLNNDYPLSLLPMFIFKIY